MKKVVIVIPVHQKELNKDEQKSLAQCQKILGHYPIYFAAPDGLNPSYFSTIKNYQVKYFDEKYFKSPKSYNQFLVTKEFYKSFQDYEYMLIYQVDTFVFSDQLLEWCEKGFDYIGAPQLNENHFNNPGYKNSMWNPLLLNGGLSLRKISSFIRLLNIYHLFYPEWPGHEDALFSFHLRRAWPLRFLFNLPTWQTALQFAFEAEPEKCYELNGKQLPFGCHAWEKFNPQFWSQFMG